LHNIVSQGYHTRDVLASTCNTLVQQDHRFLKRLVKPGMGFFSMETARRTIQGDELMNMIRKGQGRRVRKGDITGQVTFVARLFGKEREILPFLQLFHETL
jgi:hypothetical protein